MSVHRRGSVQVKEEERFVAVEPPGAGQADVSRDVAVVERRRFEHDGEREFTGDETVVVQERQPGVADWGVNRGLFHLCGLIFLNCFYPFLTLTFLWHDMW